MKRIHMPMICASIIFMFAVCATTPLPCAGAASISQKSVPTAFAGTEVLSDAASGLDLVGVFPQRAGLFGISSLSIGEDGRHVFACSETEDTVTVLSRDEGGALSFVTTIRDGLDGFNGFDGASDLAISNDGRNLYVLGAQEQSLSVLEIDDGTVSQIQVLRQESSTSLALLGAKVVRIAPHGDNVYLGGSTGLAVFARDPQDGSLSFVADVENGVSGVSGISDIHDIAFSPSGSHVYTASSGQWADLYVWRWGELAVFERIESGELNFVEAHVAREIDGDPGLLFGIKGLVVSPDGSFLYGVSRAGAGTWTIDHVSGALTLIGPGVAGSLARITGDGRHLYSARSDGTLECFLRDSNSGALSELCSFSADSLDDPRAIRLSPNEENLYVACQGSSAIVALGRDSSSGELSLVDIEQEEHPSASILAGTSALLFGPAGRYIYAAGPTGSTTSTMRVLTWVSGSGSIEAVQAVSLEASANSQSLVMSADGKWIFFASGTALISLDRDPATGLVSVSSTVRGGDGLRSAHAVTVSRDGGYVYVVNRQDPSLALFSHNDDDGHLTLDQVYRETILENASALEISADGRHLVVLTDAALVVFDRDPETGRLTYANAVSDGFPPPGSGWQPSLALDPISNNAYITYQDERYIGNGTFGYTSTLLVLGSQTSLENIWLRQREEAYLGTLESNPTGLVSPMVVVNPGGQWLAVSSWETDLVGIFNRQSQGGIVAGPHLTDGPLEAASTLAFGAQGCALAIVGKTGGLAIYRSIRDRDGDGLGDACDPCPEHQGIGCVNQMPRVPMNRARP